MISVRLLKFSLNNHLVRWRIIQICSFTWQEINFSRILPFSGEFDFFFSFSTWWNLKRLCKGFEMKTSKIFTGMMEILQLTGFIFVFSIDLLATLKTFSENFGTVQPHLDNGKDGNSAVNFPSFILFLFPHPWRREFSDFCHLKHPHYFHLCFAGSINCNN